MKKYKITALPKMQDGGSKPKKKKSKYDIESKSMFTPEDDIYSDLYNKYSDETSEAGEIPTTEGFNKFFQDIAQQEGLYAVPRKNEDGNFSFETYDLGDISDKIYNQGIRPKQMAEKMNLGNIEDLERTFKPVLDFSKEQYMAGNKDAMFNLIDEGKSPEEAIDELYKKGMGTKEGLKNIFYDDAVKTQDEVLKFYNTEMGKYLPELFTEAIDIEEERALKANREYDSARNSEVVSDTFSPYSDKRLAEQEIDMGTKSQASDLREYGTALQDRYQEIVNDADLSKGEKIALIRDMQSLEDNYAFTEEKKYDAEMEKAGMVRGADDEWMVPNHRMGSISDEEKAANDASWNIKNPYRKASTLKKFLHPIDALGHLARYGNTDRMQEEDSSAGIWHDNILMQGVDGASYIAPGIGQMRGAQMLADGIKGLGNIAAYDSQKIHRDIDKMDFFAPALNLAFGKALGGKKFLQEGLKKTIGSASRRINPNSVKNFRFKPFSVNSSTGLNRGPKDYMSGTFNNPAFSGVKMESALLPLSFEDVGEPAVHGLVEKGFEAADIVGAFKDSAKDIIGYAKGGITKGKSKIKGAGDGMFTTTGFKKGDVIGLAHRDDQPASKLGRMHNHNEEAPTMYSKKIGNERYVFANRDLEPGEELTTNYRLQPELEQPEDFQEGGTNTTREIPIAQRGGGIIKSLAQARREIIGTPGLILPKAMDDRTFAKFRDLQGIMGAYGHTGIPRAHNEFTQKELDAFKQVQKNRAMHSLKKALKNNDVTKEELVNIIASNPNARGADGYRMGNFENSAFKSAKPGVDGYGNYMVEEKVDADYLIKVRNSLNDLSKEQLLKKVVAAIESTELRRNLSKPIFEADPRDTPLKDVMEHLNRNNLFESGSSSWTRTGTKASDLGVGEQPFFQYGSHQDFRDVHNIEEGIPLLVANQYGTAEEMLAAYTSKLNNKFHRASPNSIVTGSLGTSDDSFPMQASRILRATDRRRADKLGVVPHPIFLGYEEANGMGRLEQFLGDPRLGVDWKKKLGLRASYLQKQMDEMYDKMKIHPDERLPIMTTERSYSSEPAELFGKEHSQGRILLPHSGVMKKDINWLDNNHRITFQKGGFIEADLNQKEIDNLVKQGYVIEDI